MLESTMAFLSRIVDLTSRRFKACTLLLKGHIDKGPVETIMVLKDFWTMVSFCALPSMREENAAAKHVRGGWRRPGEKIMVGVKWIMTW